MEEEIEYNIVIAPKEKIIYISGENSSGGKYPYKNLDDLIQNIKNYLKTYYREIF